MDAQVNQTDTPGDKGELFSELVRGVNLSGSELSRIDTEDDHAVITINGQQVAIKQSVSLNLVGQWDYLTYATDVAITGNYAYAVGDTLDIVDISNPTNPIVKGRYSLGRAENIQIIGSYAYIADAVLGLQIIDISNSTNFVTADVNLLGATFAFS